MDVLQRMEEDVKNKVNEFRVFVKGIEYIFSRLQV